MNVCFKNIFDTIDQNTQLNALCLQLVLPNCGYYLLCMKLCAKLV